MRYPQKGTTMETVGRARRDAKHVKATDSPRLTAGNAGWPWSATRGRNQLKGASLRFRGLGF